MYLWCFDDIDFKVDQACIKSILNFPPFPSQKTTKQFPALSETAKQNPVRVVKEFLDKTIYPPNPIKLDITMFLKISST